MKRKRNKRKRRFLFIILAFMMVVLFKKLQGEGILFDKENRAKATDEKKVSTASEKILTGKTIVIDAGHGGNDLGASGQNGTIENDVTLTMAQNIQKELNKRTGANVILTRNEDVKIQLPDRVKISNENQADLFISIHFDAFFTNDVEGVTTYYNKKKDEHLAVLMHDHIFKNGLEARNRGVSYGDYKVLRENTRPAILLELRYISNSKDESRMTSEEFQTNTTNSIVDGTIDFLSK